MPAHRAAADERERALHGLEPAFRAPLAARIRRLLELEERDSLHEFGPRELLASAAATTAHPGSKTVRRLRSNGGLLPFTQSTRKNDHYDALL